jgi:lipopolysaccharide export system protein LptA
MSKRTIGDILRGLLHTFADKFNIHTQANETIGIFSGNIDFEQDILKAEAEIKVITSEFRKEAKAIINKIDHSIPSQRYLDWQRAEAVKEIIELDKRMDK